MINPIQSAIAGLLLSAFAMAYPSFGYEPGSFFLFDIRESDEGAGLAGRIAISPELLLTETEENEDSQIATNADRSEFEVDFSVFGTGAKEQFVSEFEVTTVDGTASFGEDSFGQDTGQTTGFHFSY